MLTRHCIHLHLNQASLGLMLLIIVRYFTLVLVCSSTSCSYHGISNGHHARMGVVIIITPCTAPGAGHMWPRKKCSMQHPAA